MIRLRVNPLVESATLLRRLGVIAGTLGLTSLYCLIVLVRALFGRVDRTLIDSYTRGWSTGLLRLVRANLTVRGGCRTSTTAAAT